MFAPLINENISKTHRHQRSCILYTVLVKVTSDEVDSEQVTNT